MNKDLLRKHIADYLAKRNASPAGFAADLNERKERASYYQSWTRERLEHMGAEEFSEYLSKLWAMRIWGNKQYVVDKLIADNEAAKPAEAPF